MTNETYKVLFLPGSNFMLFMVHKACHLMGIIIHKNKCLKNTEHKPEEQKLSILFHDIPTLTVPS